MMYRTEYAIADGIDDLNVRALHGWYFVALTHLQGNQSMFLVSRVRKVDDKGATQMPRGTMNFKRTISVVVMPADMIACERDPIHEGHADCPLSPHAGKSFVARYTQWTDGATRSEYLDNAGQWRAHQSGHVIPDDCFHDVRP